MDNSLLFESFSLGEAWPLNSVSYAVCCEQVGMSQLRSIHGINSHIHILVPGREVDTQLLMKHLIKQTVCMSQSQVLHLSKTIPSQRCLV